MNAPPYQHSLPDRSGSCPHCRDEQIAKPVLGPSGRISQLELESYRELARHIRSLQARFSQAREDLIRRIQEGVSVEPGWRQVELRISECRRLTANSLLPILGEERLEHLKRQVKPSVSIVLTVH